MIENVEVEKVLGKFSPSVLRSKNGKVAVASVLLKENEDGGYRNNEVKIPTLMDFSEDSIRRLIAANLPPPLDLPVLAKLDNIKTNGDDNSKLNPIDLLSGLGLLADFEQESRTSWENYDTQSASVLFKKAGITNALYEELVSPLLHVLPMCPAYDCSAAAALSCFHMFALQSRGAFDVGWARGSISQKIFAPWQTQLERKGVAVMGGTRVSASKHDDGKYCVNLAASTGDLNDRIDCDVVVLAIGTTAAGKLASSSPALSSLTARNDFDKLRSDYFSNRIISSQLTLVVDHVTKLHYRLI
jgi:uncharacterized protein with NAD-binding domain and iron-sulfur cluster